MYTCELHVQILTLDITVRCPSKEEETDERERESGGGGLERNLEGQLSFWRLKSVCQDTNRRGGRRS
jgi:hypothetical protein